MCIQDNCTTVVFIGNTVDLFVDRLNTQLQQYESWKPDPDAIQVDAFLIDWAQVKGYAFPPFCLINRCLAKIKSGTSHNIVIVAPVWNAQVWYSQILGMLIEVPLLLPPLKDPIKLKLLSEMQEERELRKLMAVPGESGIAGVIHDRLIPFKPLWEL
jgi:hypothetical protein